MTESDYTVAEVALQFQCSIATVKNWIKDGIIQAYRLGGKGHWRIPEREVESLREKWTHKLQK